MIAADAARLHADRRDDLPLQGLGYQLVDAIIKRDYALAQTLALVLTATVIFFNFLADIAHQLVDPRVRDRARAG